MTLANNARVLAEVAVLHDPTMGASKFIFWSANTTIKI